MYYTTQVPMLSSRQFDNEVILANFDTGIYYSLSGTAADVWLGLKSGAASDEVVSAFSAAYSNNAQTAKISVSRFIEELLTEKLVAPLENEPERHPWSPKTSEQFENPKIDRFDDLRDLLLLDPIHDVGEAGWPVRAKDVV